MLTCFTKTIKNAVPVTVISQKKFPDWLKKQSKFIAQWLQATRFRGDAGNFALLPDDKGNLTRVFYCVSDKNGFWSAGSLPMQLPEGHYYIDGAIDNPTDFAIAWGLGAYQFTRYKKPARKPAILVLPDKTDQSYIEIMVESIYLVRDLINAPTEDMGPSELATEAVSLAKKHKATVKQIIGKDLLKKNYATIYTVGRACDDEPRLIDIRWGNKKHRKLTLVGKGVCFDTGGLDIKPASAMLLMKKDMGGAAHVLGLAKMIMHAKLPINLRVLIPAVENSVSGNAYRPGDVIKSRKGLTIEIGNTDAEGRLVLADALTEAVSERPDLIIDIATLTGAARVALGTELPALFANDDAAADKVIQHGRKQSDPVWRLPLFDLYRDLLNSSIADINNSGADSYAGAITAALFLKEFVPDNISWMHFDLMAWNLKARPGRPQGGEAMALRALFSYITNEFIS